MLETELFALLEQTADAAYTVTEGGEICSWNGAAERLFGYTASEVLHRNIDEVLEARDTLGTSALAGGSEAATRRWDGTSGGIPNFDLEVRTRSRGRVWVNVSTIAFDNQRTGRRLFVRLERDLDQRRRKEDPSYRMLEAARHLAARPDPLEEIIAQLLTPPRIRSRASTSARRRHPSPVSIASLRGAAARPADMSLYEPRADRPFEHRFRSVLITSWLNDGFGKSRNYNSVPRSTSSAIPK